MHEDVFQKGVLADRDPHFPGQGPDPLDAVLAVSEPRSAVAASERPLPVDHGMATETPESRDQAENAPRRDMVQGSDDYGEFSWPDGYAADPTVMEKFLPLAKRIGLHKEAAQELASFYADLDLERNRSQAEFIAKNNAEWVREIQSHPEFGGPNLQRTGEGVAAMFRRYGSPLLTAQIRQMNIQNWPEMFYFLARVSQAVSEDTSPASAGGAAFKSTAQLLFPGLK